MLNPAPGIMNALDQQLIHGVSEWVGADAASAEVSPAEDEMPELEETGMSPKHGFTKTRKRCRRLSREQATRAPWRCGYVKPTETLDRETFNPIKLQCSRACQKISGAFSSTTQVTWGSMPRKTDTGLLVNLKPHTEYTSSNEGW